MNVKTYSMFRFDADEGKVFDWKEERWLEELIDPDKGEVPENIRKVEQQHLYAKTIFIGENDSIENYIEVDAPAKED